MSIFDSQEDGVQALVRTGRHGRDAIEWNSPFVATLYIQKDHGDRACVVALKDEDFAEFDPRHNHESPTLLTNEDYALEIFELPVGVKG